MKYRSTRSYRALILASLVGPALMFAAVAAWSWNVVRRNVDSDIDRGGALLHEQVLRLLQVDRQLLYRVDDRVAGMEWPEIIKEEPALRDFLKSAISQVTEVNSAFIVDANGTPQVSNGFFPLLARMRPSLTAHTAGNRSYFLALSHGQSFAIGKPHKSLVSGESVIDVAARLSSEDGSFRGAIVLIVSTARLANGWKSIVEPGDTVSLVDPDGTVLARYPTVPLATDDDLPHFNDSSMRAITSANSGIFDSEPSAIDRVVQRAGFRKLGEFPLYIVYAIARTNIRQQWYPTLAAFGCLSLAAAAGLALSALVVIRRARSEEQERRFSELLIENSIDGIIGKDKSLRYTVWSRGMEVMTGIPRDRVLGRRTDDVFGLDAQGTSAAEDWQDALGGRTTSISDRPYRLPQTGHHGFYDQILSPLRDREETIVGAIAFVHDSTERHRVEAELRQAQKMEAVGQLTGGIAHDFNNLLTVIFGNLETLQRRTATPSSNRKFIDAAVRAAERAATLTDRLLAFARRQPLVRRPIDLNHVVAGTSDLLRRTLGERITIETILTGGAWRVWADANQLENALLNLAVNARDAMPDSGKLTIKTGMARVAETSAANHGDLTPGEYGIIEVRDTGCGMQEDVIARAFEPFFTTKEVGKGSGLGLSQVYGFVKQLGGHVAIDSQLGQGTNVMLYLPRVLEDDQIDGPVPEPRVGSLVTARRGVETILVVEDDDALRDHLRGLLQELGYRVIVAPNGARALEIVQRTKEVALMFTDIGLPGKLTGFELAGLATARHPQMKVVFTTGYSANAALPAGQPDEGCDILVKPFTSSRLAAKIRQVLDQAVQSR